MSDRPAWWSYPTQCSQGHQWAPGKVIVSWLPCNCEPARQAGKLEGLGLLVLRIAHDQHAGIEGLIDTAAIFGGSSIIILTPVLLIAGRSRSRATGIAGNVALILIPAILVLAVIGYLGGIR
jgi:hypothetical protein